MMIARRWQIGLPFIAALAVFLYLIWAVFFLIAYPYDGVASFSLEGVVEKIYENSPASKILQIGDRILLVDGMVFDQRPVLYQGYTARDVVSLTILRNDEKLDVQLELGNPPLADLVTRLAPLIVAFIFWILGLSVQAFKPVQESDTVFLLFFQSMAALLITGILSSLSIPWSVYLIRFLLWVIGPLAVHFHFHFPQTTRFRYQQVLLTGLYITGVTAGLFYAWMTANPNGVDIDRRLGALQSANRVFVMANLALVVASLFYIYRHATTAGVRSKIRLVVLGGALSLLPLITLVILPNTLDQPFLPDAFMSIFISILPLTYGFAIFRYRLIEIEKHVNRGATYILVYSVLIAFYLTFSISLHMVIPEPGNIEPVLNTILILVLASIFIPLHRYIQHIVDTVFYGGWYDYRSAISEITQGLEQITDLISLAEAVSRRLVGTLRLEDVCVFLADQSGDFSTLAVWPQPAHRILSSPRFVPLPRSSLSYLLNMGGVVERNVLKQALSGATISSQEMNLLESEQVYLWVPVIGHGNVIGLLALGPKYGGDIFSGEDMDILRVVARNLAPLIENIHLVSRLRGYTAELEERVKIRTEELSASKERVEAILASVGEGVIVTSLDGNIQTVNAAFLAQSGFEEYDLLGNSFWDLYQSDIPGSLHDEVYFYLYQDMVWNGEATSTRKDGTRYEIQLTIAPLRDPDNQIMGYVGSQRDITHQKELDRLKDMFVSDVSHELRTPTTNIGLYLELLENSPSEKHAHYLKILKEQSRLLVKLVEDILDLSRLASGKHKKVELIPVDINPVVEQVILAHRPQAQAAGLDLYFAPGDDLASLLGEPNQLSRLVNNLVSNAIHYSPEGHVKVSTFQKNDHVCLEVADTGIGIDAEDLPHLFERFYRGRQVRQSRIHGTGLGLAIVKEIADMHEGSIHIVSEVGQGSKFLVEFPAVR